MNITQEPWFNNLPPNTQQALLYRQQYGQLTDNDIAKLKGVAAQLSNPMTLNKFIYKMPAKFEVSSNPVIMDIAIFGVNEQTGKTENITKERIKKS